MTDSLTFPQIRFLTCLSDHGPGQGADLGYRLGYQSSAVRNRPQLAGMLANRMGNRLRLRGLVSWSRKRGYSLTQAGLAMLNGVRFGHNRS